MAGVVFQVFGNAEVLKLIRLTRYHAEEPGCAVSLTANVVLQMTSAGAARADAGRQVRSYSRRGASSRQRNQRQNQAAICTKELYPASFIFRMSGLKILPLIWNIDVLVSKLREHDLLPTP